MSPKFSLQNVLDVRHGKVEMLEVELGKLILERQDAEQKLLSLRELQSDLLDQLNTAQSNEVDLVKAGLLRVNIAQVKACIDQGFLLLTKLDQAVEAKRTDLVQAKQSEETLEILKRKRHEIYLAEQVQIEARLQDDIYIARAFRTQQGV